MKDYQKDSRFQTPKDLDVFMKNILIEKMKEFNITKVSASFDGCGDEGQFDSADAEGDGDIDAFMETPVKTYISAMVYSNGKRDLMVKENDSKISELILDTFYFILEDHHDGWEINEGSYGIVYFNVDGSGKIEYNERITDVEYSEDEF
jgi:hypothetical protein